MSNLLELLNVSSPVAIVDGNVFYPSVCVRLSINSTISAVQLRVVAVTHWCFSSLLLHCVVDHKNLHKTDVGLFRNVSDQSQSVLEYSRRVQSTYPKVTLLQSEAVVARASEALCQGMTSSQGVF